MPYIAQSKRAFFDAEIDQLARLLKNAQIDDDNNQEGNFNYIISSLIHRVYGPNYRYRQVNDIVGMLECVKQEFYREVAAPYEDQKAKENGAVY
jgi:hypothetical protein